MTIERAGGVAVGDAEWTPQWKSCAAARHVEAVDRSSPCATGLMVDFKGLLER